MPKSKMQSGYIDLEEKSYIFTYDGELLQLVPKEQSSIKPYDFLVNKNIYLEVLKGTTIGFENIFFELLFESKSFGIYCKAFWICVL